MSPRRRHRLARTLRTIGSAYFVLGLVGAWYAGVPGSHVPDGVPIALVFAGAVALFRSEDLERGR